MCANDNYGNRCGTMLISPVTVSHRTQSLLCHVRFYFRAAFIEGDALIKRDHKK